jgi:hypothetical protein
MSEADMLPLMPFFMGFLGWLVDRFFGITTPSFACIGIILGYVIWVLVVGNTIRTRGYLAAGLRTHIDAVNSKNWLAAIIALSLFYTFIAVLAMVFVIDANKVLRTVRVPGGYMDELTPASKVWRGVLVFLAGSGSINRIVQYHELGKFFPRIFVISAGISVFPILYWIYQRNKLLKVS